MEEDRRHQEESTRDHASKAKERRSSKVEGITHEGERDVREDVTRKKYELAIDDQRGCIVQGRGITKHQETKS
jgi:hypothetical protein